MFPHNSTTKSQITTKISRKVVRATTDIPHQFQGAVKVKVKVTRPLWLAVQVTTSRGGDIL